jgi:hypothetical protein
MGRSVSYPRGAIVGFEVVTHLGDGDDFAWFADDLKQRAAGLFPSLYDCNQWRGREDHILMRNAYADFGDSEYCGLASIWIAERCDRAYYDHRREARAAHWLAQIRETFLAAFGELLPGGHMSNGEGVYRRKFVSGPSPALTAA